MLTNKSDSFIAEVYEYFTDIGYGDRFSVGIICILLTESGGDPSYVEYSNKYSDECDAFLSHKNDSKKALIEAYHSYGNIVFADNAAETDMYRDDEGNYCVGVGIMLWTGNRGYEMLSSANNDWTELAFQLDYLADQLNDAELTPEKTKDLESYEDAINTIAYNFLMVPEDSAHLDEYMNFIDQVENVISD